MQRKKQLRKPSTRKLYRKLLRRLRQLKRLRLSMRRENFVKKLTRPRLLLLRLKLLQL
jgi:hypothetical protein